jgi:hypothetical protein
VRVPQDPCRGVCGADRRTYTGAHSYFTTLGGPGIPLASGRNFGAARAPHSEIGVCERVHEFIYKTTGLAESAVANAPLSL